MMNQEDKIALQLSLSSVILEDKARLVQLSRLEGCVDQDGYVYVLYAGDWFFAVALCPDPTTAIRCEKIMPRACNVSQKTGHS